MNAENKESALPVEKYLDLPDKIIGLHRTLSDADIPHAFGGAMAADYYRIPRGTADIDLGLFVRPHEHERVLDTLGQVFEVPNLPEVKRQIMERDQAVTRWGNTRVDLFFSVGAFHDSIASRVVEKEFAGEKIPVLSAEDIVVLKALFDRTQDWADIEAICELQGDKLERPYITGWLKVAVGADNHRLARIEKLLTPHADMNQ